jgi:hypothetical protein
MSGLIETSLQLTVRDNFDTELEFIKQNCVISGEWSILDSLPPFLPSILAQRYVSGLIETSLQLTFTVTCDPELDFLKQNWVMSAEWSTLDSLHPFLPSSLAHRNVSCVIETSLQLTVAFLCDPELDFLKQNWVMFAELSTLDSLPPFLPSSLTQRYVSGVIETSLQLTVRITCDPEHDFLKQNWAMSAEWCTRDTLPPFLSYTGICVLLNTDISVIKNYGYI